MMTHRVQSGIITGVPDRTESKRQLLTAEMQRYFGDTCPALAARWEATIVGLAPALMPDLAERLQVLEAATNETNQYLRAAFVEANDSHARAEPLLDRALASLEHLNEIAETMMRWLNELSKA
jgi:hypothetical protein